MKKSITQTIEVILIITVIFFHGASTVSASSKTIDTDHFIINYTPSTSSCAASLTLLLESYHKKISDFLEIDSLVKINVILTEEDTSEINFPVKQENIKISTDGNFKNIADKIYNEIFAIRLHEMMRNNSGSLSSDKNFTDAVIKYSRTERGFIELILNDLVNEDHISSIAFDEIQKYSKIRQDAVYTVLIDFIITKYGKKIFIQSLKDADYYSGFYKSLSRISGDEISVITENFNTYLQQHNYGKSPDEKNRKKLFHNIAEFSDIAFSISEGEQAAILQKNENEYRLHLKSKSSESNINLKHAESGSWFNDLVYMKNDQLALVEIIKAGSTIHIYNMENSKLLNSIFLPYIFISNINSIENGNVIFSAACGSARDIYTFNFSNMELNILTESGNNYFPLKIKDKVYFVSKTGRNSINEFDTASGEIKTLFSTDQDISHLSRVNEKALIFSLKLNGLSNIFSFDLQTGTLHQITKDNNSNMSPRISGKFLYFFSFFQSNYRIFFDDYNNAGL
jgi:hypothetical protein